jgi:phosphoglycolate phosphatase-like HAD superfamily hydrolase
MIGDIGSDVAAAHAAGARAILIPTPVTRAEEIAVAPAVASHLDEAVDAILAGAV